MIIKECDKLAALLHQSGRQWACQLQPAVALRLLEHVRLNKSRTDLEKKMELALDSEAITDEDERHAYKSVLGHVYANRAKEKREALRIPFAPR